MPQPKTESIKFYYNGFKINGERKLNKCSYQLRENSVSIHTYGYFTDLPKDLFVVYNDTDSMTDYFDCDHAEVQSDHPLYKYIRAAAINAEIRSNERSIAYNEKRAAQASPSMKEYYEKDAEQARKWLAENQAELAALGDVGQPTAADIEAVAAFNTAAETARIQAEHDAEIAEREERLARQHEETVHITELMEKYPVREGEPYVEIGFSENGTIFSLRAAHAERVQKPTYNGGYVEDFGPLVLSPLAANYALVYLDSRYNDIGCDKTDFAFIYIDEQGNEQRYTGGYDIGYEHKSLLEHMREFDDENAVEMTNVFEKCLLEEKGFDNITPFPRGEINLPSGGREVAETTPSPEKDLAYFEDLLDKTTERVFSSREEWDGFLRVQGKFYKYDFRDRLMIYAQNPNATACADMDIWVNRMGRTVVNEENAVALISKNQNGQQLRFVFDVADTDGKPFPNLWRYTENNRNAVISALQSDSPPDLVTLERAVEDKIENMYNEALDNLADTDYNSFMELKVRKAFSISSAKTIILTRCGVEAEPFSEEIPEFENDDLRLQAGQMIGEMSASVLRTVERAARQYIQTERSKHYENDVHREEVQSGERAVVLQERQLLDSDDSAERSERPPESRAVRVGEVSLFGGRYAAETRGDVHEGDALHALSGGGSAGGQAVRRADGALAERSGSDRGIEATGYAQVGRNNGELPSARNGDSSGRADTGAVTITTFEEGNGQFSLFGNPETQNTVVIEAESVQTPSAFSMPQNVVDLFLQFGSNTTNHRKIIAAEFSMGKSNAENAAFLSELYHGGNGLTIDGKPYSTWYGEDGIAVARGSFARYVGNAEIIPWEQAAGRISEMLEDGTFATADELTDALHYERAQLAQKLWYIERDLTGEAREAGYLSVLSTGRFRGYSAETAELAERLADPEFVSVLAPQMQALYTETLDGAELLRFNYHYLGATHRATKDLLLPRKEFVTSMTSLPEVQPFITEDEIDKSFTRGSGVSGGAERIIEFFGADHTQAEREKFLSREYGIGGRSHALSGADNSFEEHNGKGVTLKKGDCTEVKLSWSQVAKRIDTLIKTDRYVELKTLTAEAIEAEIKAQQAEREGELVRSDDVPSISEIDLPDLTVLPEDMHGYGYTWDGMLPLSENTARRLFEDENLEVFCLYNDDTETAITDVDEIEEHAGCSGLFGIQADVWQKYLEVQRTEKAAEPDFPSSGTEVADKDILTDNIKFSITSSEHPAFYDKELNDRYTGLSFALGNKLLGVLDEKQHRERESKEIGWYHKTDFEITATIGGEDFHYDGRFDIGDGEGDLIAHIKNYYDYCLSPDCPFAHEWKRQGEDYYTEQMESLHFGRDVFIPFLEQHTELTQEDEKLLTEIMSFENAWFDRGKEEQPTAAELNLPSSGTEVIESEPQRDYTFEYQLLSRLQMDCDYFLSNGGRYEPKLWAGNVNKQIAKMRELYDLLPEKPDWLTADEIDEYERKMQPRYQVVVYHSTENGFDMREDYQSFKDALTRAKAYVDGTAEEDGFKYEGAAIFDNLTQQYVYTYGEIAVENEPVTQIDKKNIVAVYHAPIYDDRYESRIEIVHYPIGTYGINYGATPDNDWTDARQSGFETFDDAIAAVMQRAPNARKLEIPVRAREQSLETGTPHYTVEQTSDAFTDPFIIRDNTVPEGQDGQYYDVDGIYQTFETEEEAQEYADTLNSAEHIMGLFATKNAEREAEQNQNINLPSSGREVDENVFGNFRITDDNLGVGGAKAKYQANVAAIRLLKQLEAEGLQATPEQQEILSRYVGWGGLADAFDPRKENWQSEYNELKDLLTDEEYRSARGSVNNAHYTSPTIIRAIYSAVERMGFEKGKILEPAMGVGNFFGMLPESMQESQLYGVELDDVSGRIAKQLYPTANITVAGFETTDKKDFYDLAIGNVPFGDYTVNDREYNKFSFAIHDYFFAKSLDQVRPGGIVAFVTSRYTLDKKSSEVRRHLAQRAELLGAIRLPNTAFKANAGAGVVTDIIFLQKRERPIVTEPDWVHLDYNADGFAINSYFVEHPEMILGRESSASTQYGRVDFTVEPFGDLPLDRQLSYAIQNIEGKYEPATTAQHNLPSGGREVKEIGDSIPADPNVRDYSYAVVDGKVYFREGDTMRSVKKPQRALERIAGMAALRDQMRRLIDLQIDPNTPDAEIAAEQEKLSKLYDDFVKKNGLINDKANSLAFRADQSYYLLCALEDFDKDGNFVGKSAIFTKRTIQAKTIITHTETAAEALAVSLSEKGKVDLDYICELTDKDKETVIADLKGVIYKQAEDNQYVTADEYLSGNIRRKLEVAEYWAQYQPEFEENVAALKEAMPEWLTAEQIEIRLGATWIDPEYIEQFIYETLDIVGSDRARIEVAYEPRTATWSVIDSRRRNPSVLETVTYGTERKPALSLIEDALNLKHTEVFDYKEVDGKTIVEKNITENVLAQDRQEQLKNLFIDWIWQDPERRENLEREYNERFNSTIPRTYDGEHLTFPGMNPEIQLTDYQKNAVARRIYGSNELLGHAAGAGKTYTMIATAQKMKQLGLCSKSMFVVPNHLTKQWAREYVKLYPNANILVATDDDLSPQKRKKFCARIATGDYDAVIIKQSQFEKIPVSAERRQQYVQNQLNDLEITAALLDGKDSKQNFSIKQLEKTKKKLEAKLEKMQETLKDKQDDMLSFEQLGIDNLFVDEAHHYKNLAYYTKMSNVAGISNNSAQLASDMEEKCQYINEITGYKGITFATATFIMNSVAEQYVMQRYLQPNRLEELGWSLFDSWTGQFGEVTLENELAPEGNVYRERKRLSRFSNLPELMRVFHEVADIKRASELNLPLPEAEYHVEVAEASEIQKEYVAQLGERAAAVHMGMVEPQEDNMLKIVRC